MTFAVMENGKKALTMAEYIEREAAIRALLNDATGQVGYCREDAADCIRYLDSADVAPVRHARWEECHWVEQDGPYSLVAHPKAAFRCSGCKYVFKKELLWKDNYCPNCGCKMDLEG